LHERQRTYPPGAGFRRDLSTGAPIPVFSRKLAGDGISIDPIDNILRAPCAGEIMQQHAAGHALTLKTAGGVEVLMHVGIDTVTLRGQVSPRG
jgi:phosphotransferase system IIA component